MKRQSRARRDRASRRDLGLLTAQVGSVLLASASNVFDDEPDPVLAITGDRPPELSRHLISRLWKSTNGALDCLYCLGSRRVGIRNSSTINHILIRIESKLHNLKGHSRLPSALATLADTRLGWALPACTTQVRLQVPAANC